MVPRIAICNGIIRSGSTWSFNVSQLIMRLAAQKLNQQFYVNYFDEDRLDEFLRTEMANPPGPAVIKAHFVGPLALAWIRDGRAKAVCSFRDPRDCVASDMVFMGKGFDFALSRVGNSLKCLAHYQDYGRTLFIRYEDMLGDTGMHIRRIASHLDIGIDSQTVAWIDSQTNLSACRAICQELLTRPDDQVGIVEDNHRVDPITHLHHNHIGSVTPGRWREDLTADQGRRATKEFATWLRTLGYESEESLRAICPPPSPQARHSLIVAAQAASPLRQILEKTKAR